MSFKYARKHSVCPIKRCQEDLNSLENWRRPPGRPRTTWMKTIQQDLKSNSNPNPWTKQLTRLRIVHSGDWCQRLTLSSAGAACHRTRRRRKFNKHHITCINNNNNNNNTYISISIAPWSQPYTEMLLAVCWTRLNRGVFTDDIWMSSLTNDNSNSTCQITIST